MVSTLDFESSDPSSSLGGTSDYFFSSLTDQKGNEKKLDWPRRDSNTQPSDLESDALPLRHGVIQRLCNGQPDSLLQPKWACPHGDVIKGAVSARVNQMNTGCTVAT